MTTRIIHTPLPLAAVATLLAMLVATPACAATPKQPRVAPKGAPTLTVMTFNVNYGLRGDPLTVAVITKADADLVFLQETTPEWERTLRATLKTTYPHMAFHHCCGAGGMGVLSKRAFTTTRIMNAPKPGWFPAWIVRAQTPLGVIQALNVHLRPPVSETGSFVSGYVTTPAVREAEIRSYYKHLDPKLPTLIMGDFNEDTDGRAVQHLRAHKLRSVLPEYHPKADTWRWTVFGVEVHSRLDHIIYPPATLQPLNARVLREGRSDHFPVVATFTHAVPDSTRGGTVRPPNTGPH